jgi:hypothetical protein
MTEVMPALSRLLRSPEVGKVLVGEESVQPSGGGGGRHREPSLKYVLDQPLLAGDCVSGSEVVAACLACPGAVG